MTIPISIADQLDALIQCREQMEATPTTAWNQYLEGHYGPERKAAVLAEKEARIQELKAERDRIINALNLPAGVIPIWGRASVEVVAFRATLVAPRYGNQRLGEFPSAEEAAEAINTLRANLDAEAEGRIRVTQASLPQKPSKSGLPSGVIKREAKSGDRYAAMIDIPAQGNNCARKRKMVGTFDTPEEAHNAYRKAHIDLHGERSRYWSQRHEL